MKTRNWTSLVTIIVLAALAITIQLSAQDNPDFTPALTTLARGDGRSKVIVYDDSLADNGNIYKLFGFPGPPYWHGRWSNGPVAIEDLAKILGMPLLDYAYAGATTGLGNIVDGGTAEQLGSLAVPGITAAYNTTIDSIPPDTIRHSLFVVFGGGADFASDGLTTSTADHAVAHLVAIVSDLQRRGARRILVPGLLDLGMTPNYRSQGLAIADQATYLSNYLNQRLVAALPKHVTYFDTYGLYHQMAAHPGAFGLTNVVDQCFDNGVVCAHPNQYLFWDFVHPTAHVHFIVALKYAFSLLGVDESESLLPEQNQKK